MAKDNFEHHAPGQDKSRLFFAKEVAKATGISRATILRMEERGLLTPAYTAPSGLRYYDNYNVSRIMEVQRLQAMGFSNEEALLYFSSGGDAEVMFALVEERLRMLQWTYEEMRLRAMNEDHRSAELIRIPAEEYYVERTRGIPGQEIYDLAYNAFHDCVAKGYALAPKPLVVIHECDEFLAGDVPDGAYPVASCTPILPGQKGPEVETYPASPALIQSFCGDFHQLYDAYAFMGQEARRRGLTPAGYLRSIWVVGPYTGRELGIAKYRARIILPVSGAPA